MAQAKRGAGAAVTDDEQGVDAGDSTQDNASADTDTNTGTDEAALPVDLPITEAPVHPAPVSFGAIAKLEGLARAAERAQDWGRFTKLHNLAGALAVMKRRVLELDGLEVDDEIGTFLSDMSKFATRFL